MRGEDRHEIVVVGGGPAGVTAALRARELGASVALVERGNMGGTCTNDGCVPTRVLAHAARLARDAGQFADYGLIGEAPRVDFTRLLNRTQRIVYRVQEKKQLALRLEAAGVRVFERAGRARFVDPHTLALAGGGGLRGEKFVLCAGGHARRMGFPGSEHALTHSDVWKMKGLPSSVAVVGAAAAGCQLASVFAAFGSRVRLLDVAPRILGGEDAAVSHGVAEAFGRRGIEITTGIGGIERLEERGGKLRLFYKQEDEIRELEAGAVVLAVGWPGNVGPLDLAAAGVQTERGYVTVDDALRTSAPHVFAAGDLTGRKEVGDEDCAVAVVPYADLDRGVIDGRPEGSCKLVVSRSSRLVLGAHIVGEQAVEVVQLAAAAMRAGMPVEQLADLELAYPTFTAVVGLAARRIVRDLDPASPRQRASGRSAAAEWEHSERG